MTVNEIDRFNEAVRDDPEMLAEVKAIGADVEKLIRFANERGFDFTEEDLQKRQAQSGELSDSDLDDVAGGGIAGALLQVVTVVGVVAVYA